jgi:hypothetical protein
MTPYSFQQLVSQFIRVATTRSALLKISLRILVDGDDAVELHACNVLKGLADTQTREPSVLLST